MIYDYVSLGAFAEGWGTTVGMNKHKALYPGRHTDAELDQDPGKARTLDVNLKLWDECALVFHRFGINKVQELVGAHATRRGQLVSEIPGFGDLNAVHLSHREQLPYGKTLADFWIASYLERMMTRRQFGLQFTLMPGLSPGKALSSHSQEAPTSLAGTGLPLS